METLIQELLYWETSPVWISTVAAFRPAAVRSSAATSSCQFPVPAMRQPVCARAAGAAQTAASSSNERKKSAWPSRHGLVSVEYPPPS